MKRVPIYGLDAIRFLAALMVVAYHLGFSLWVTASPALPLTGHTTALHPWAHATWFGFLGVQIFFVMSGFVIAYSAERSTPFAFVRDRLVRLWPAVAIVATLSALIFLTYDLESPSWIAKAYLREVLFIPFGPTMDIVVWTLGIEVSFYALVLLVLCLRRFDALDRMAAGLACVSAAYHGLAAWLGCSGSLGDPEVCSSGFLLSRSSQLLLLDHGCFFALGVFLWLALIKGGARRHVWWAAIALVGCLLELSWHTRYQNHLHSSIRPSVPLALGIWVVVVWAMVQSVRLNHRLVPLVKPRTASMLRLLGLATYPLYLLHFVLTGVLVAWAESMGLSFEAALIAAALACIALSIVLAGGIEPAMQRSLRARIDQLGTRMWAEGQRLKVLFRSSP